MKKILCWGVFITFFVSSYAQVEHYDTKSKLKYCMSIEEMERKSEIGQHFISTLPPQEPILNIAEFQPMQAVLVRYPLGIPVELIAAMSEVVKVVTLVSSNSEEVAARSFFATQGINMEQIEFIMASTDSYWSRDYGPWFIIDGNDEFGIVDFIYNRPRPHDDQIASVISNELQVGYYAMNMVHTGGNYMTDGYGIAASTSLVVAENVDMNVTSLQNMANEYLGIEQYNFMEDPLGDYIEHIDCWGKFLGVDKVLIGQVSPNDSRYNDYEEVADFFANAVSAWGNHYRVYRVFTPGGFADVTPYTNSLILNDHVFVPQTGSTWDADAITAYQQAMPGYTIVPVMESTYTPWENTDALHCRTHEMADLRMLLIQHKPLLGNQTYQNSYTIDADITAYSGETLIADSVLIYYKINDDPWQSSVMLSVGGKRWEGTISGVPEGSEVKYYLFAKDESQRREKHPYIGIHDPHTFMAGSVGIAQTNPNRFKLYPNPVSEYCIITGGYVEQVTVFNSIGQLMEQRQVKDQTIRLACSSWNSGIYFIKLEDETGNFTVKRMIKK